MILEQIYRTLKNLDTRVTSLERRFVVRKRFPWEEALRDVEKLERERKSREAGNG